MKNWVPALPILLLLAACGSLEATPEPGEYRQTVKIITFEFPDIAKEERDQMIESLENIGNEASGRFCMDAVDRENQWKETASQMSGLFGGQCETVHDGSSGNKLDLKLQCTGTPRGDVSAVMTGTARADGYSSRMTFNMHDPASGQKAKLAMDIGAERLGECSE